MDRGCPVERYRFTISDGNSFDHVEEATYASPLAAEAHAILIARELSDDGDTWHGGWISVTDTRGNEIALVPIGAKESSPGWRPTGGDRSKR